MVRRSFSGNAIEQYGAGLHLLCVHLVQRVVCAVL